MKKIITATLLIFCLTSLAQQHDNFRGNSTDRFNYYLICDPVASIDDGLNIGIGIEYVGSIPGLIPIYVGAQYRTMPALEDGYNELVGKIGLPFVSGFNAEWEYRIGIQLGVVKRWTTAPTFKAEIGFSHNIDFGSFEVEVFIDGGYQWREDFKLYDAPAKWQGYGNAGLKKRF